MSNNNQAFDITTIAALYDNAALAAAQAQAAKAAASKEASKQGKGIWGAGLQAVKVAHDNGHNAATMLTLFSIALASADVPEGTFKGYQSDLAKLREEVQTGKHPLTGDSTGFGINDALNISRANARKRYKEVTPEEAARTALNDLTKDWDADNLQALVSFARTMSDGRREEEQPEQAEEQQAVAA